MNSVSIVITISSQIYNDGRFNGPVQSTHQVDSTQFRVINIGQSANIALIDSNISAYDPRDVIFVFDAYNVT